MSEEKADTSDTKARIKDILDSNIVVLFMKGTKQFPQCGFSSLVSEVLRILGVSYVDINILEDEELRSGVKEYANWPTLPQLYVKGEFVGGCDIVKEMYESGELVDYFKEKGLELQS